MMPVPLAGHGGSMRIIHVPFACHGRNASKKCPVFLSQSNTCNDVPLIVCQSGNMSEWQHEDGYS